MGMSRGSCLILAMVVVPLEIRGGAQAADEKSKEFPQHNCKYTPPGSDWVWADTNAPNMIFLAENSKGHRATLTVSPVGKETINERAAKAFESTYYEKPIVQKRGGRLTTFQGVPAYQTEGNVAEKSFATRYFIANGNGYLLTVIGGTDPIENDNSFESIMNGFAFLTPVSANPPNVDPVADDPHGLNVSRLMGKVAGICLVVALVVFLVRKAIRPKVQPRQARRVDSDETEGQ
jgi:hypothetical protein